VKTSRTVAALAAVLAVATARPALAANPPVADRRPVTTTLHGDARTDEYAWLRHKENPEVIAYLDAENAYTERRTAHTKALQETLYEEMLGRLRQTDLSVPYRDGD
jgi:oligopeptidase B